MQLLSKRLFLLVLSILALSAFLSGAAVAAEQAAVLRATLKNGMRVVVVRNPLAPVVATQVNYLVGSNESPAGFAGTAHALEHMMFRGSPGLSGAQLSNLIAALGGEFNAATQQTVTQYFFTVPAEALEIALHIEAIRMRDVRSTETLWREERGAIEQEVAQNLSDPQYIFYNRLLKAMFSGTPYARDALGTRPSFRKTTGAMLRRFHRSWYGPNNAILVIVGDVNPRRTLVRVKRLFEEIPRRSVPRRPAVRPQPLKPAAITLDTDLPYGMAVVAYRLPGYYNPDFAAGQVLADVLGSRRGNLYALVPEGKALFAEFSASALPKAAFGYGVAGFPHGGDGAALVAQMKDVIAGYVNDGIPQDLVEAAKRREVADAEFQRNSVAGLASAWSQALAVEGRNSPEDDIEAIKRVTAEDVNRVAREFLVNDTALTAVLTPRPSGKPVESAGPRGKESFAPKETRPVALPPWAKKALLPPSLPAPSAKPAVTVLPNGLRLIVQPETISPTVSVYGRIKNNPYLQTPKGQEGVAEVLSELFSYGTTTLNRLAFQEALDEIAAGESAGTSFSLHVLADRFDRGVQLLADHLLHPALPEDAFQIVRRETARAVAGRLQSPGYLSDRALRAALYPKDDPALREATPETVGSLTLENVKDYYNSVFRPDLATIVVIGQVTAEQVREVFEKYFGDWKAVGPKPETDLPPVPPNKPSAAVVPDASRVQSEVTLAQTVAITRAHRDYYSLQVGNHVLTGAFYATRLYRDLRERTGLVYSVEAWLSAGKTRSLYQVSYASDPPNVSKARALVERNLREMQTKLVTPAELQQAKTLLLRQIPLSRSSTEGIAGGLLHLALEDLPLDEPERAARRYLETTAAQVRAAFALWIRPRDFVQITLGPNPK